MVALTAYEAGMCECGHPRHICHHTDNDGWFNTAEVTCHAQAAVERVTGAKDYRPEPGVRVVPVYARPKDKPLPALNGGKYAPGVPDDDEDDPGKD